MGGESLKRRITRIRRSFVTELMKLRNINPDKSAFLRPKCPALEMGPADSAGVLRQHGIAATKGGASS